MYVCKCACAMVCSVEVLQESPLPPCELLEWSWAISPVQQALWSA